MTDAEFIRKFVCDNTDVGDEDIADLLAIAKRLEADEWQPIETAPTDGLFLVGKENITYICAPIIHDISNWTHWKPLPKGPQ